MSYEDDQELIVDLADEARGHRLRADELEGEVEKLKRLLRLPLLFHQGAPWRSTAREEWESITGDKEATTLSMCSAIKRGLEL